MHVVATAGHVDHGKSALVRALTGMEPDRYAEEQRRGMTIDLGFVWTTLPSGVDVAFVDVPGHERFVPTMLAGVGPVPAVLLVVAADEGWMPQTQEHVAALDALGVAHGIAVVTKCDVADPDAAVAEVRERLAGTSLAAIHVVTVSAVTGAGLDGLRAELGAVLSALPAPSADAPVRLWVDRAFTIAGAGTVVTGTLAAGTLRVGDELELAPAGTRAVVRGLQSRGVPVSVVDATARVAVNLRGVDRDTVARGMALVTPGRWTLAAEVDVLVPTEGLAAHVVTHIGAAALPTRVRALGPRAARLRLDAPLPLHLGDRLLLREPAGRRLHRADVADLAPPPLRRRGDAARLDSALAVPGDAGDEVRRRGVATASALTAAGLSGEPADTVRVGTTLVAADRWEQWTARLADFVDDEPPVEVVRRALDAPSLDVVAALVARHPAVELRDGRLCRTGSVDVVPASLAPLLARLDADPLDAPAGEDLRAFVARDLAAAVRARRLLHLGSGVYVGVAAPERARAALAALEQPFTVSAAREALGSSRRVVVPLLEHLDAARVTRKLADGTRVLVTAQG